MAQRKVIVGLKGIDGAIKSLDTRLGNIESDVQAIAVAIVTHAAGDGNGDMSRALKLCQTVNKHRSFNVAFLVGWFRYFASTTVNLKGNDGKGKVSLMSRDAKGYRGFDVDGAKANNWNEAFDADGNRSTWYAGPAPAEFKPETVGDLAERMHRFVKNTTKLLSDTKAVNGKDVPVVSLTEQDRQQVENAMAFIDRIANTLARHEDVAKLEQQLAAKRDETKQDNEVVAVISAPKDKAVA